MPSELDQVFWDYCGKREIEERRTPSLKCPEGHDWPRMFGFNGPNFFPKYNRLPTGIGSSRLSKLKRIYSENSHDWDDDEKGLFVDAAHYSWSDTLKTAEDIDNHPLVKRHRDEDIALGRCWVFAHVLLYLSPSPIGTNAVSGSDFWKQLSTHLNWTPGSRSPAPDKAIRMQARIDRPERKSGANDDQVAKNTSKRSACDDGQKQGRKLRRTRDRFTGWTRRRPSGGSSASQAQDLVKRDESAPPPATVGGATTVPRTKSCIRRKKLHSAEKGLDKLQGTEDDAGSKCVANPETQNLTNTPAQRPSKSDNKSDHAPSQSQQSSHGVASPGREG